jgi:hypothetical protein
LSTPFIYISVPALSLSFTLFFLFLIYSLYHFSSYPFSSLFFFHSLSHFTQSVSCCVFSLILLLRSHPPPSFSPSFSPFNNRESSLNFNHLYIHHTHQYSRNRRYRISTQLGATIARSRPVTHTLPVPCDAIQKRDKIRVRFQNESKVRSRFRHGICEVRGPVRTGFLFLPPYIQR